MAKAQSSTIVSPFSILAGGVATVEHAKTILEFQNWAAGYRPKTHLNVFAHPETAYASDTPRGMRLLFSGSVGIEQTAIITKAKINPDAANLTIAARCAVVTAGSVSIKFYVGSATGTIAFLPADNGAEKTGVLATSATGTGWQTVTVTLIRTLGAVDASWVETLRIQDEAITTAASLPDPPNS